MNRVAIIPVSPYPAEHLQANEAHANSLGLPTVDQYAPSGTLAVVGGGPSAYGYVETLRRWEGHVWAVNGAYGWCRDNEIEARFFSVDPNPIVATMSRGAVKILGSRCDPSAFDGQVYLYPDHLGGCSSVGNAACAGLKAGFHQVTLFGCESNYQQQRTHAYIHHQPKFELIVRCAGMHFLTTPSLLAQSRELAIMILESQGLIRETSGGLLRAMVNAQCDYEIAEHTPGWEKTLEPA